MQIYKSDYYKERTKAINAVFQAWINYYDYFIDKDVKNLSDNEKEEIYTLLEAVDNARQDYAHKQELLTSFIYKNFDQETLELFIKFFINFLEEVEK